MVTAKTIKVIRAFLDLSQGELAEQMGVSASYVSAIEKGDKRVTSDFSQRFRRVVGLTDAVLMDIEYLQHKLME